MTPLRRGAAMLGVLLVAFVVVVWGGTIAQSRQSGEILGPCTRGLEGDSSPVQNGHASIHWFPPRIHCSFAADRALGFDELEKDVYARVGIIIAGAFVTLLLFALLLSWANTRDA